MKKMMVSIAMLTAVLLLLPGCSYKELDDKIQQQTEQKEGGIDRYTSEGRAYIEMEPVPEETMQFKGVGGNFPSYVKCLDESGNEVEAGIDGLEYTLNQVTVYPSVFDSPIPIEECTTDNQEILENNIFLLVDLTAHYTAPSRGEAEVIPTIQELNPLYLEERGNAKFEERKSESNSPPYTIYFSGHPTEDDERLDPEHQYSCYIIADGDSLEFQLGIVAGKELVDSKNVFLQVSGQDIYMEGCVYQYFDLLSENSVQGDEP